MSEEHYKKLSEIYRAALIEIVDYLGDPFSETSDKVTKIAREALSPANFTEDDPRAAPPDFIPGASPPVNPEEAEKHHKKHMEHLLEKSSIPAVHYLAAAMKHLLANAFALGKMNDEHAGRLNRLEDMTPEPADRSLRDRIEKLEHEAREFQPWRIGESPVGLLNRIEALEKQEPVRSPTIRVLVSRVEALEEIIEVVPPERRPSFRIQKLEDDRLVERDHRQAILRRVDTLDKAGILFNTWLSELVNMLVHARSDSELKEVLKSFQRRLVQPKTPVVVEEVRAKVDTTAKPHHLHPDCTCFEIMVADETRHFRGCPLREKYPTHEAEKPVLIEPTPCEKVLLERIEKLEKRYEGHSHPVWNMLSDDTTREPTAAERADTRARYDAAAKETVLEARALGVPVEELQAAIGTQFHAPAELKPEPMLRDAVRRNARPVRHIIEQDAPVIVTLCGSTRFSQAFADANLRETLAGKIVLSVGSMTHSDTDIRVCVDCGEVDGHVSGKCTAKLWPNPKQFDLDVKICRFEPLTSPDHAKTKAALDVLHKKKIDLADEVLILNQIHCAKCHGYRGDAKVRGKDGCEHDMKPYIGDSTRGEIRHAFLLGKPVRFLNDQILDEKFWESIRIPMPLSSPMLMLSGDTLTYRKGAGS